MTLVVTAYGNPRVKAARGLRDKRERRASGRFLAEGLRILTEALDAGVAPLELWRTADSADHPLVARLEAAAGETIETTADILAKLTGKDNPGAVAGVYAERPTPLAAIDRRAAPLWLVAERMRDPGNLGTMLRTGDAVGAGGLILLDECVDPFSVEAVRASMGALFTQALARATWEEFLPWLRGAPGQLVGASLAAELSYREARYAAPTFVLIGNESQGLPPAYEAACDLLVKIPMHGRADSLNAAVSAAVLAYEVRAQLAI